MLGKLYDGQQDCAIAGALEVIGERWTLLIVRDAMYGVRRFSEFQAHLEGRLAPSGPDASLHLDPYRPPWPYRFAVWALR